MTETSIAQLRVGRRLGQQQQRRRPLSGGFSVLYITLVMVVVFAFATLAMDYGRVQLAKTQLRIAADSAAKWGVQWVSGGAAVAHPRSSTAASDNSVDGTPVTLSASEVLVGNWNPQTRAFTPNIKPRNAIQINVARQVPLALGGPINMSTCTVRASATAMATPMSIVGFNGIAFKNNTFVASYNSAVRTNPTQGNCNDNGALVSNGVIGEQNNGDIRGDVVLGPSGSVDSGFTITGGTTQLTTAIPVPADPAWSPSGNPGGVPQAYTVNANTNLPGGTYWLTSLRVNRKLGFTGPATLYVNGNVDINEEVTAFNSIPGNLKIYVLGARTFSAEKSLCAQVIAPRSHFTTVNNFKFYGACWFNTIEVKNNCEFFYDEALGSVANVSIVK